MPDFSNMRLGKRTPRHDRRVPMLTAYTQSLPAPPPSVDYTTKLTKLGMMLNDQLGDCTCAAVGHVIQQWTSITRATETIIPDADIEMLYEKVAGYVPGEANTDNGAVEIDVLNYWLSNPVDGNVLDAYASIEPQNHTDISDAIYLFGNCYIGVQLPASAKTQDTWAVPPGGPVNDGAPGSWGGHAIPVVAYDQRTLTVITWGALKQMTWQFFDAYCDEAYALLCPDWELANGDVPPANFPWATVTADIQQLKGVFGKATAIKHV